MISSLLRFASLRSALGLLPVLIFVGTGRAADKVEWRVDYDTARKEALEKNKPLFLDFGTEDCVHCKRLHTSTFKDPAVVRMMNERFVPLKIDAHREPRLAQALRIQAYPTIIIAGQDGKIHAWIEGYMDAGRLSEHLQRATAQQAPDWMTRDYQEAVKSINAADYAAAVALLKKLIADGKDPSIQTKARETLQELENQAAGRLARAKQMQDKGQTLEAVDTLTELLKRYAGTEAAEDGSKFLASLADKPDIRNKQRGRRAQEVLAQAKDDFKHGLYLSCLDHCEILGSAYKEFPEGKEGIQLGNEIKANPERMARVCESMQERLAVMYMTLAETWIQKGQPEQAAVCLQKVLKVNPNSNAAQSAQVKLTAIQGKAPNQPVMYDKP